MAQVLYALLFLPRFSRSLSCSCAAPCACSHEVAPPPATISGDLDPIVTLDALLAELEGATARRASRPRASSDRIAEMLEAAAASLERVG